MLPTWDLDRCSVSPGRSLRLEPCLSNAAASSEGSDALGWLDDLGLEGGMRKMGRVSGDTIVAAGEGFEEVIVPVETIFERGGNP